MRAKRRTSILDYGDSDWRSSFETAYELKDFRAKEPFAEDWGWIVPIANREFGLWIGCGHYQEYPDGYLWVIEPHKPFIRRFFKRIDTREIIAALQQSMDRVLTEDSGIRAKRWWTYEEFIRPSGAPR